MKLLIVLLISGVVAFFASALWFHGNNTADQETFEDSPDLSSIDKDLSSSNDSPFAVQGREVTTPISNVAIENADAANSDTSEEAGISGDIPSWDASLSEDELGLLVARLKNDPALLAQLMDEFRQELDPDRKKRLAMVLGEVGGEQVTLLASELIFSGDSDARSLGMDLLQDIQPGNAQARNIASNMLATEVDPDTLVDAMTALASPGEVDVSSRAYLSDQLALLATHEDESVRSISLDILSRWSDDGRYTDVLVSGLDDSSEYVRASAAYALVSHENQSLDVVDRLFSTLRASLETTHVKRAVILALRSMPLTAAQNSELVMLERKLDTVVR